MHVVFEAYIFAPAVAWTLALRWQGNGPSNSWRCILGFRVLAGTATLRLRDGCSMLARENPTALSVFFWWWSPIAFPLPLSC